VYGAQFASLRGPSGNALDPIDVAALYGTRNNPAVHEYLRGCGAAWDRLNKAAEPAQAILERAVAEVSSWSRVDWEVRFEVSETGNSMTLAVQYLSALGLRRTAGPLHFVAAPSSLVAAHSASLLATVGQRLLGDAQTSEPTAPALIMEKLLLQAAVRHGFGGDVNRMRTVLGGQGAPGLGGLLGSVAGRNLPLFVRAAAPSEEVAAAFAGQAPAELVAAGPVASELVAGWYAIATATSAESATDGVVRLASAAFASDVRRRVANSHVLPAGTPIDQDARQLTVAAFPFVREWMPSATNVVSGDVAAKLLAMARAPLASGADAARLAVAVLRAAVPVLARLGVSDAALRDLFSAQIRKDHRWCWALVPLDGDGNHRGGLFAEKRGNSVPIHRIVPTAPDAVNVVRRARVAVSCRALRCTKIPSVPGPRIHYGASGGRWAYQDRTPTIQERYSAMSGAPNPEVDTAFLNQVQERMLPRRELRLSLAGPDRPYLLALLIRQATVEQQPHRRDGEGCGSCPGARTSPAWKVWMTR
jgi:hypothetical protein